MSFPKLDEFQKARLKLTFWYIVISTVLLGVFTIAAVSAERVAFSKIERALSDPIERPRLTALLEVRIREFDSKFIQRLLTFDIILLGFASLGSFFLSGETLKPITQMLEKQEEFAADASHELRTPLTTIQMEIEAFKRTQKIPKVYEEFLENIGEEVKRMKDIVAGLLILFRKQAEDEKKFWKKVELAKVVERSFSQIQELAASKKISLSKRLESGLTVLGDEEKLHQVFLILLDNAIKYTREGGEVKIDSTKEGKKACISVADTGIGIAPKDMPFIFERFYRGAHSRSLGFAKGTGLGLSIAKKIVQEHKGKIFVKSALHKGSVFTIELPLVS